jgi:hypothetical protein
MGAGEVGIRSAGPPTSCAATASKSALTEREERLVDVGPFVIPPTQAAKLTEPRKCALHDPPPPAQATDAWPARARGDESGDRAESRPWESRSIPPRLQTACKHTRAPLPACSQAGSRQKREVPSSLTFGVGGVDGTRARSPSPQDAAARLSTSSPQTTEQREGVGGVSGTSFATGWLPHGRERSVSSPGPALMEATAKRDWLRRARGARGRFCGSRTATRSEKKRAAREPSRARCSTGPRSGLRPAPTPEGVVRNP